MLVANAWHHRSDALSSLVAIGGIGGSMLGITYMDAAGGVLVSGLIAKTGFELGWGAVKSLTDRRTSTAVLAGVADVAADLVAKGEVRAVRRVRCRQLGSYCLVDAFALVDASLSVGEGHEKANLLRSLVMERHPEVHDVMVHVCPAGEDECLHH